MSRKILVTAAAGRTGSQATMRLLEQGRSVRALVRRLDERADKLSVRGAEIAVGDLTDLSAMSKATRDVGAVYFNYPILPNLLEAATVMLQVATENKIEAIVNMSQISARRDAGSHASRKDWLCERTLDHFAGSVVHLRPTMFAEWLTRFWDRERSELRLAFSGARHAPIAAEDLGRVISAILIDPNVHAGKTYELFGKIEMDHYEIAAAMTRVLGRRVTYVPIEVDQFRTEQIEKGFNPYLVQHLTNVAIDYQNGIFSGTNEVVRTLTSADPLGVEDFIARNREFYESDGAGQLRR
ncbi:NmrA family NAD(P)-binding protein [Streptomyces mirabilis]|uniref:NmrA family NAD(P)-binding protein n=1 Tax=Streptomyces mirabilis TaxID=68239 RepID=UPI00364BC3F6